MIVRANLYPIARGLESSKSSKKQVTFINSYYGKRDADGLFLETSTVNCWLSSDDASNFKFGNPIDGVIDVNGDFISLKEFSINGKRFIVNEKSVAELVNESKEEDKKEQKNK